MVLEGGAGRVWAVAFHPDRKHFFNGTDNEIQRWRVEDGQELGKQTGMVVSVGTVMGEPTGVQAHTHTHTHQKPTSIIVGVGFCVS